MERIKRIVKKTPIVRTLARYAMRRIAALHARNFNSAAYWEGRYREGRTSGAGSYNRLAIFKADVLNQFVKDHDVHSVIEFGSGDGSQLRLAAYPCYIGVDISKTTIDATRKLYASDPTKTFIHADELGPEHQAEISLSLDVIYHLVENEVFRRYMSQLCDSATRFMIAYSSNENRPSDSVHVRHRKFTDWIAENRPEFRQIGLIPNPYPEDVRDIDNTSFADFYIFERVAEANQT
jgi:hypothetical protein